MPLFPFFLLVSGIMILSGLYLMRARGNLNLLRHELKTAFIPIDQQLQRRNHLIPNLIETTKVIFKDDRQTLEFLIAARNQVTTLTQAASIQPEHPESMINLINAEKKLRAAFIQFHLKISDSPQLQENQHKIRLLEELSTAESKLQIALKIYHQSVVRYNLQRDQFPMNLLASSFGFLKAESPADQGMG